MTDEKDSLIEITEEKSAKPKKRIVLFVFACIFAVAEIVLFLFSLDIAISALAFVPEQAADGIALAAILVLYVLFAVLSFVSFVVTAILSACSVKFCAQKLKPYSLGILIGTGVLTVLEIILTVFVYTV